AVRRRVGFVPAPLRRTRSTLWLSDLGRHCRCPGEEGFRPGSQENPAPRTAQDRGRIQCTDQAAQRRYYPPESRDRKGSGGVILLWGGRPRPPLLTLILI